jgi:uncharacterized protein
MKSAAPLLQEIADIAKLLEAHAELHALLSYVESLDLSGGWIGAGFIRNVVWDTLHGRSFKASSLTDVDVIYLDPADTCQDRDIALESKLRDLAPDVNWQVRNQARMHLRNGDAPYRTISDAIAHWPETATAIAARTIHGKVEVVAPYGIADLIALIVRPTPAFAHKMEIYHARLKSKDWAARWPGLRFCDAVRDPAS